LILKDTFSMTLVRFRLAALAAAAAFGILLSAAAPAAEPTAKKADDPVVAVVNGSKIHRSEVEDARRRLPPQFQEMPAEVVFGMIVNSLVDSRLVAAEARKKGLHNDREVKEQMARIEEQVLERAMLIRHINEKMTEADLKQRYDAFVAGFQAKEQVRARHILLETEEQAKEVIAELDKGADFAELAGKRSVGPSAGQGGDLGYFAKDELTPAFAEAAFAIEAGKHSAAPVQTQFGWHVIKVEDRRTGAPPTFEESREQIKAEAAREIASAYIEGLRTGAAIQRFKPDGSPAE
jgi:peptidyl-prolyl cis-trans isomerase C